MRSRIHNTNLKEKACRIKMILLDNDGVLTDGSIIFGKNGVEYAVFDVKDGLGIKLAQEAGIIIGIISGLESDALKKRAASLKIDELHTRVIDKKAVYEKIRDKYKLEDDEIAFIGDDVIDIPIMIRCGFSAAVNDAHAQIKKIAHFITNQPGGKGAVREFIDFILTSQNHWKNVIKKYYE
ncbi:MAG: HAD hydrolase family protein [Acidobacteria bacterium]|nr:HAD hydrolase family protein [Acidobacteriota bacterium]